MRKLTILLSLITDQNDYQLEQAATGKETAHRLGIDLQVIFADSDSVTQSQQLLKAIQSAPTSRPDAIVFEPIGGTGLPQVASAAAAAGIGWAVLNRDASYISDLRRTTKAPIFCISSDHKEIGRIQGQQIAALLPSGGTVLYIQGPSDSFAAQQRTLGMQETKPRNVQVNALKGQWTETSGYRTVSSWLRLVTSQKARIDAVIAQNDAMAMGARKAFGEQPNEGERDRWLKLPFTGCDGLPKTGQAWVRSGLLAATVIVPPNAPPALEAIVLASQKGVQPAERIMIDPKSFPVVGAIATQNAEKFRLHPVG